MVLFLDNSMETEEGTTESGREGRQALSSLRRGEESSVCSFRELGD